MKQPAGHHLAEFNFGVLRHDWDDPRVADFADNLDHVNAIAEASPGFVWRLNDDAMDQGQNDPDGVFGGNARAASALSVWTDAASLNRFVWKTVHRQFYDRRREWFAADGNSNLVLWWVPIGHRPDLQEGMTRFDYLRQHGETDHAFGRERLEQLLHAEQNSEQVA
ncbi:MAG: DUF3291 domain-containing protein [Pseudomonadota bacterium]|nr:DUF3291 domain-containing protein [Pseudomonadota bacterium]